MFKTAGRKRNPPAALKATWVPGTREGLFAQVQPSDQRAVTLNISLLQVLQHVAAAADHQQQTAVGMVVVLVELQVLVQVVDPLGQQSDLHFGRTGVAFMLRIGGDDLGLGHGILLFLPVSGIFSPSIAVNSEKRRRFGSLSTRFI